MKFRKAVVLIIIISKLLSCSQDKSRAVEVLPPTLKKSLDSILAYSCDEVDAKRTLFFLDSLSTKYVGNDTTIAKPFLLYYKARCFRAESDINIAFTNAQRALSFFEKYKQYYKREYISVLGLMGVIKRRQAHVVEAEQFVVQALHEVENDSIFHRNTGNFYEIGYLYFTLANLQADNHQFELARRNSKKCIAYYLNSNLKNPQKLAKAYMNLGLQYQEYSNDSALYYIQKGLSFNNEKNDIIQVFGYELLGEFYNRSEQYDSSNKYLMKVYLSNAIPQIGSLGMYDIFMQNFDKLGDQKQSEFYYQKTKAEYLSRDSTSKRFNYLEVLNNLMDYAYKSKKYEDINLLLPYYKQESTSLFNEKKEKLIREFDAKYNVKLKSEKITKLESEKLLTIATLKIQKLFFGLVILLLVLGVVVYLFILNQKKYVVAKQKMELEQRLLLTQMNPHFMFNALSAIQKEIILGNNKLANTYLTKYANLTRLILDNSRRKRISLNDEIQLLTSYLELQKIRFKEKFVYHIGVDESLKKALVEIPPMLVQPFIENVLEHGFREIDYLGELYVEFKRNGRLLICTVKDNGAGTLRKADDFNKVSHSSDIVRERLDILGKETNVETSLKIIEGDNENLGYQVILTIPLYEL